MAEITQTDWAYAAGFVDGEGCIAITRTFIPLLPPELQRTQEDHYRRQREMNHRGTKQFVPEPMHSPRRINRARASQPLLSCQFFLYER